MKRDDIQGLRTLAILGVILSHIWPNYFPNGGLCVEIFFVISGYLIAKCLNKIGKEGNLFETILNFYKRRIQRIVPIYLILIFVTAM
uniref:Acyltransferase 3 domain-containing protein n=1 Tax=Meloidogyne incognita TaxID=6306 RepID=A0A914KQK8_MELIC